jgi:subtilisin family serine protease
MAPEQKPDLAPGEMTADDRRLSEKQLPRSATAVDLSKPVIVPRDGPPADFEKTAREPVIIEVVLKDPIAPDDLMQAVPLSPDAQPTENANLVNLALVNVLQQFHLQGANWSFGDLREVEDLTLKGNPQDVAVAYRRESFLRLRFPPGADAGKISEALSRLPGVAWAGRVPKALPPAGPRDEPSVGTTDQTAAGQRNQWYIFRCRVNEVWDMGFSGDGVIIADIDFGFCVDHQDLKTRIALKRNSVDGSDNVSQTDDHGNGTGHGTAVLGLAGAAVNGQGIAGIAFGATLWAIQANCGNGTPLESDPWINAMDFVCKWDSGSQRKIILLEHETDDGGNFEEIPSVRKMIMEAIADNVVVCIPAGNGCHDAGIGCRKIGTSTVCEAIPETGSILVGATDYQSDINPPAAYTNFGKRIAVSAPGDLRHDLTCGCSHLDPFPIGFGGTSGAAAKVAGAIALMLEANSTLTPAQVKEILSNGPPIPAPRSRPIGCFLDVKAAVDEARNRRASPLHPIPLAEMVKRSESRSPTTILGSWLRWLGSAFLRLMMRRVR